MNIILISGIVLVAAAVGLLGFVLMQQKKTTKKEDTAEDSEEKKSSKDRSEDAQAENDKAAAPKAQAGEINVATKSFFILCTLTFWVLFASASYWAYVAQPLYGLIVACAAILVYAILVVLQEVLKNLISLNQGLLPSENKE